MGCEDLLHVMQFVMHGGHCRMADSYNMFVIGYFENGWLRFVGTKSVFFFWFQLKWSKRPKKKKEISDWIQPARYRKVSETEMFPPFPAPRVMLINQRNQGPKCQVHDSKHTS